MAPGLGADHEVNPEVGSFNALGVEPSMVGILGAESVLRQLQWRGLPVGSLRVGFVMG